jgi:hypothetical protein
MPERLLDEEEQGVSELPLSGRVRSLVSSPLPQSTIFYGGATLLEGITFNRSPHIPSGIIHRGSLTLRLYEANFILF